MSKVVIGPKSDFKTQRCKNICENTDRQVSSHHTETTFRDPESLVAHCDHVIVSLTRWVDRLGTAKLGPQGIDVVGDRCFGALLPSQALLTVKKTDLKLRGFLAVVFHVPPMKEEILLVEPIGEVLTLTQLRC